MLESLLGCWLGSSVLLTERPASLDVSCFVVCFFDFQQERNIMRVGGSPECVPPNLPRISVSRLLEADESISGTLLLYHAGANRILPTLEGRDVLACFFKEDNENLRLVEHTPLHSNWFSGREKIN